jgi:CheY-like chemotaxis protein
MRVFIIENDLDFAESLAEKLIENDFDYEIISVSKSSSCIDTVNTLKDANGEFVLFIYVNLLIDKGSRQYCKGIELLTWLRIKGVMNHCFLYSFQTLEAIARSNEQNRLLFSKGTTFIQLSDSFEFVTNEKIIESAKVTADDKNLRKNIKPLFDIGKFRHKEANWWGVKQLWDVHKIYTKGDFVEDYPAKVKDNLQKLNNAIGSYLYEWRVVSLTIEIERFEKELEEKKKADEEKKSNLANQLEEKKIERILYNEELTTKQQQQIERRNKLFSSKDYYAKHRNLYDEELAEISLNDKEISKLKAEFEEIIKKEGNISSEIEDINEKTGKLKSLIYKGAEIYFSDNLDIERQTKCKILIVDDEPDWKTIYEKILQNAGFDLIVPGKKFRNKIADFYDKELKPVISKGAYDLILLDLRLFEESDPSVATDKLSGKQLLEYIKKDYKGIPILITTASNKIWTYQKLIDFGADAYWIKEGVDEQRDFIDSIKNYCRFIFLVSRLTDETYKLLRKLSDFADEFKSISDAPDYWAKNVTWANGFTTQCNIIEIQKNLDEAVLIFKRYLQNFHLNSELSDSSNKAFFISGLINKVASVYENVHMLTEGQMKKISRTILDSEDGKPEKDEQRKDSQAKPLMTLRNEVSHYDYKSKATWDNLEKAIDLAKTYLKTPQ